MDLVLRAVVLYLFVVLLMRIVGRRELSTLAPSDFVLLIVLGDVMQQGLTQDDYSVTGVVIVVTTIALLQIATGFVSYKSRTINRILAGEPIVLIEDGRLLDANLRRQRLRPEDVAEEMRVQGIAAFSEVRWGILESNGKFSFVKRDG